MNKEHKTNAEHALTSPCQTKVITLWWWVESESEGRNLGRNEKKRKDDGEIKGHGEGMNDEGDNERLCILTVTAYPSESIPWSLPIQMYYVIIYLQCKVLALVSAEQVLFKALSVQRRRGFSEWGSGDCSRIIYSIEMRQEECNLIICRPAITYGVIQVT